jgi:hypothetical protein
MASETRPTYFETGTEDEVVRIDGYGKTVDDYEPIDNSNKNPLSDLSLDNPLDTDAIDALDAADDLAAPSAAETFGSINTPTSSSALDGLSGAELEVVTEALKGERKILKTSPGNVLTQLGTDSTMITTSGGGEFALSATEGLKVTGGMKVLTNVFGDSAICGILENLGLIKLAMLAVFDLTLEVDLVECISELIETVESTKLKDELIVTSGSKFAANGNVRGVKKMAEAIGADRLMSKDPEIINKTNQNYKRPRFMPDENQVDGKVRETTTSDNPKLYQEMDETYSMFDPDWGYETHNGNKTPAMGFYQNSSDDAKEVMSTNNDRRRHIAVSSTVSTGNQATTVQNRYEGTIVKEDISPKKPSGTLGFVLDWMN